MCRLHVRSNFYRKKHHRFMIEKKKRFLQQDIKHMTVTDGCYVTHCVQYNVVTSLIGSNSRDWKVRVISKSPWPRVNFAVLRALKAGQPLFEKGTRAPNSGRNVDWTRESGRNRAHTESKTSLLNTGFPGISRVYNSFSQNKTVSLAWSMNINRVWDFTPWVNNEAVEGFS